MSDLALDNDPASPTFRDLLVFNGDLQLIGQTYGIQRDAVLQHVLQRLREFLGECFVALGDGMPYYQTIFTKGADQSKIDALFINQILGTPGVVQLNSYSFSLNRQQRVLNTAFAALSTSGIISYAGLLS